MKRVLLILVLISVFVSACVGSGNAKSEPLHGETLLEEIPNLEPRSYKSIADFKNNMKEFERMSDSELQHYTDRVSLKVYRSDFFFEPEQTPPNAVFTNINVRDVYVAFVYHIDNDIHKLIPEYLEKDIAMSLAYEYASLIIYEWQCTLDKEGFISTYSDDMKKICINNVNVYYTEETIGNYTIPYGKKIKDDNISNAVIRRDFFYMLDGNSIHVVFPYSITLEEAEKYLFVKKVFYK